MTHEINTGHAGCHPNYANKFALGHCVLCDAIATDVWRDPGTDSRYAVCPWHNGQLQSGTTTLPESAPPVLSQDVPLSTKHKGRQRVCPVCGVHFAASRGQRYCTGICQEAAADAARAARAKKLAAQSERKLRDPWMREFYAANSRKVS
jgi:hypothetical protein